LGRLGGLVLLPLEASPKPAAAVESGIEADEEEEEEGV